MQGIDDAGTPTNGQFEVARSGDNITPGADSVDGLNIAIADHSSATATSGSITYTVTGKSVGGDDFTRTLTQPFSVTTQGAAGDPGATGPTGPTFDFLTGSLDSVDTTGGLASGLLQTSQVFGYHKPIAAGDGTNAQLSDFTSYLDAGGNFYLGGNESGISASGDFGYFAWNNSDRSLLISGSAVDIQVDQFYLGRTDQYISGSGGNIEIKSSTFHLERDGDLNMQGNVTASNIMINGRARIEGGVTASGIMIDGGSTFKGKVEIQNGSGVPGSNLYQHGPLTFHPRSYGTPSNDILPNATWNDAADNAIEYVLGPMGNQELAITAYPDASDDADGGFNSDPIPIDPTCAYMYVIYMKRTTHQGAGADSGSAYFGTEGLDDTGADDFMISNDADAISEVTINTNPYFMQGDIIPSGETAADALDRWFLHVGYVYPSGSAADPTRKSAVYDLTTGLTGSYSEDNGKTFVWHTGATQTRIRAYHYYNATGDGSTKFAEFARPGIFKMDGSEPTIQSLLSNVSSGNGTIIDGSAITTGMIQSANVNATAGSRINLSNGTIQMGGTGSNAGFSVDSSGFVKATNFAERVVDVDAANSSSYFEDMSTTGVRLLFDGSGGGDVTMNLRLKVAPFNVTAGATKPIKDIKLPSQTSDDFTSVRVIVAADNVQFEDGSINSSVGEALSELDAGD